MDEELSDLIRKIFFTVVVLLVFAILVVFVIAKNFGGADSTIEKDITDGKDMILLVREHDCSYCGTIKRELWKANIYVDEINKNTNKRYHTILRKLNISEKDIKEPSLIIVKDGKVETIFIDIKDISDINEFIEYNNQSN